MKLAFAFSLFAASMFAGEWSGTISDAKCAKAHMDASEKSMKCVPRLREGRSGRRVCNRRQSYQDCQPGCR